MANLVSEQELFFTAFEPKMKNRFILYMDGIPSYIVNKVSRPKLTQEAKPLDHINVQRYVKGKTKWGTMAHFILVRILQTPTEGHLKLPKGYLPSSRAE